MQRIFVFLFLHILYITFLLFAHQVLSPLDTQALSIRKVASTNVKPHIFEKVTLQQRKALFFIFLIVFQLDADILLYILSASHLTS